MPLLSGSDPQPIITKAAIKDGVSNTGHKVRIVLNSVSKSRPRWSARSLGYAFFGADRNPRFFMQRRVSSDTCFDRVDQPLRIDGLHEIGIEACLDASIIVVLLAKSS